MDTRTDVSSSVSMVENTDTNKNTICNRDSNYSSSNNIDFMRDLVLSTELNEEKHKDNEDEGYLSDNDKKSNSSTETRNKNDNKQGDVNSKSSNTKMKKSKQNYGKRGRTEDAEYEREHTMDATSKKVNSSNKRKEEEEGLSPMHSSTTSKKEDNQEQETKVAKKKTKSKEKKINSIKKVENDQHVDKCLCEPSTKLNREECTSEKWQEVIHFNEHHHNSRESKFAHFALLNSFGWEMCELASEPVCEANLNENQYGYGTVKWTYTLRHTAIKEKLVLEIVSSACDLLRSSNNNIHDNKQQSTECCDFTNEVKDVRNVSNDSTHECENSNKGERVFITHIHSINGQKFTSQHDAILFLLSKSITAMISAHGVSKDSQSTDEVTEPFEPTRLLSENSNNHFLLTNTSSFLVREEEHNITANDKYNTNNDHNTDCTRCKSDVNKRKFNSNSNEFCENLSELHGHEEEKLGKSKNNSKKNSRERNQKRTKCKIKKIKEEVREENEQHEPQASFIAATELATESANEEQEEGEDLESYELQNTQERSTMPLEIHARSPQEQSKKVITKKVGKVSKELKSVQSLKLNKSKESKQVYCKKDVSQQVTTSSKHTHLAKMNVIKKEEQELQEQHEQVEEKEEEKERQVEKRELTVPSLHIHKEQKHACSAYKKSFSAGFGHHLQPLSSITTLSGIIFENEKEMESLNAFDEPVSNSSQLKEKCLMSIEQKIIDSTHEDTFHCAINSKEPLSSSAEYLKYTRSFSHEFNEIMQSASCTHDYFTNSSYLLSVNKEENSCACTGTESKESNKISNTMSPCEREEQEESQKHISSFADAMAHSLEEVIGSEELSGDALYAGVSALNQYYSERYREQKSWQNCKIREHRYDVNTCHTNAIMQKDFSNVCDDANSFDLCNNSYESNHTIHNNSNCTSINSETNKMCNLFPRPRRHTFLPIHGSVLRALQRNINSTSSEFNMTLKPFNVLPNGIPLTPRIVIPRTYHRRHEWILHMINSQNKREVHNEMDCSVTITSSKQHASFTPNPESDIWEYVYRRFGRMENSASTFNTSSDIDSKQKNSSLHNNDYHDTNSSTIDFDNCNNDDKEKDVITPSAETLSTSYSHASNSTKEKKAINMDRYLRANRDKIMPVPMPDVEWFYTDV